jgi:nitrate reductase NapE component
MKSIQSQLFVGLFVVIGLLLMWDFDVWSLAILGGIGYWAYSVLYGEPTPNNRFGCRHPRQFRGFR